MNQSLTVSLDTTLAERGVAVIFVLASGEVSTKAADSCATAWERAQKDFTSTHPPEKIFQHPHLQGYRDLHTELGLAAIQNTEQLLIPSPESLIRILLRDGSLRTLGAIVDLYNTVALRHLISAGAHDADKLGTHVALAMNAPEIKFRPLGQKKKQLLPPNEYSYTTDRHRAICRLECKQANETKLRPQTARWLFILQGNANISVNALEIACQELTDTLEANTFGLQLSAVTLHKNAINGVLTLAKGAVA